MRGLKIGKFVVAVDFCHRFSAVLSYKESDSRGLCAPPDNDGVVFLGNSWSAGLLIDVATGKTRSAPAPKGCAYGGPRRPNESGDTGSRRMRGISASPPDGFDWKRQPAGDDHDAFGIATPKGDLGNVIVGVDSKTKAVRWQQSATSLFGKDGLSVEPLEVGNGVLYAEVSARVVALGAANGEIKWRASWQGDAPFNVTLTSSRLYVVSGQWPGLPVDVFDIASGKLLARLGHGRID
jgi:outer membrane protein assembly factor BamB